MKNTSTKKEANKKITAQPEAEVATKYSGNYTGYFYKNVDRLWDAVQELQQEVTKLQTAQKGAV